MRTKNAAITDCNDKIIRSTSMSYLKLFWIVILFFLLNIKSMYDDILLILARPISPIVGAADVRDDTPDTLVRAIENDVHQCNHIADINMAVTVHVTATLFQQGNR